jgi:NADPH:quinone reductase-like Zn-dependent oxidoreductase
VAANAPLAIDDVDAVAAFNAVNAIADTVGSSSGARLIKKVKAGGCFGYASFLPPGIPFDNQPVTLGRVSVYPNPDIVREFAKDLRDGKFVLPIRHRFPLSAVSHAHTLSEVGGAGKIILEMCHS